MSEPHTHSLTVHGHGPIHLIPAHAKLVAMLGSIFAFVATPPEEVWAFAVHALLVAGLVVFSEVPFRHFFARLGVEVPFVIFALALPFLGGGPTTEVLGLTVSSPGLLAAWNILAKATLGVALSILIVSTTEVPHLLEGLRRLRVPAVMVSVAGFMVRYLEVIGAELRRMRIAMSARGYEPTWAGQARALGMAGGALFVRSYERGERVHQAMLARGFTGAIPSIRHAPAPGWTWPAALSIPVAAWIVAAAAVLG